MKSKLLLSLLLVSGIVGCAQTYTLKGYNGPEVMQNTEVVQVSKQCLYAKLRPNVHYLNVKTDQGRVMVPVNVTCEPY
jgi:hypothetical protein